MTYQDKLKQKEYNKLYHEKNKAEKKAKAETVVDCIYCTRKVNHCNLVNHQKTSYCIKRRTVVDIPEDIPKYTREELLEMQLMLYYLLDLH